MHAAKFTAFYVIALFVALASASPIPLAVAEREALALPIANIDIVAREPMPVAEPVVEEEDVEARLCRYGCL